MQNLPPILSTYFEATNAHDVGLYASCFTENAKVKDQQEIIQGRQNIANWNREVNEKYNSTSAVKSWIQTSGGVDVTTEVAGTFPGSPIELTFRFKLQNNKISQFEIN
ncbi:nuclear transport factor 2 family protein [Methylophilus methylotrophus]|uniref:nuclear transport factor 2 family protein n=1 Tax=Methylophilus methylotrophus TaxID=17 RepID=UPI000F5B6E49|nr:nuclear transport factor 2 family protein [Methylophilus methylotrophus]